MEYQHSINAQTKVQIVLVSETLDTDDERDDKSRDDYVNIEKCSICGEEISGSSSIYPDEMIEIDEGNSDTKDQMKRWRQRKHGVVNKRFKPINEIVALEKILHDIFFSISELEEKHKVLKDKSPELKRQLIKMRKFAEKYNIEFPDELKREISVSI